MVYKSLHYNISEVEYHVLIANCVDPDEMPPYAASHLGFHNLMISYIEYGKYSKISNTFFLCSQINGRYQAWNSQNACQESKQGRLLLKSYHGLRWLSWPFLAGNLLVLKNLEHLL